MKVETTFQAEQVATHPVAVRVEMLATRLAVETVGQVV